MITLVALMCHAVSGYPDLLCHEEIVARADTVRECMVENQMIIADWKAKSRFAEDEWVVAKVLCAPGNYQRKDEL